MFTYNVPQLPADPVIRDNLRRWFAHHKRYQYIEMPHAVHSFHVGKREVTTLATQFRRHKLQHGKRYTGKKLRELRAARGCGRRKPALAGQQQLRISMPWNPKISRVVSFVLKHDDAGKPYFGDVRLIRTTPTRDRRDRRLESSMTDEKWLMLFKRIARRVFPKTGDVSWKDAIPHLIV